MSDQGSRTPLGAPGNRWRAAAAWGAHGGPSHIAPANAYLEHHDGRAFIIHMGNKDEKQAKAFARYIAKALNQYESEASSDIHT